MVKLLCKFEFVELIWQAFECKEVWFWVVFVLQTLDITKPIYDEYIYIYIVPT